MKTLLTWEVSNKPLHKYLTIPCEINEDLYNYIIETTSPSYCLDGIIQDGEPMIHKEDIPYYMTVSCVGFKYFYLGILPEFKSSNCDS